MILYKLPTESFDKVNLNSCKTLLNQDNEVDLEIFEILSM